MDKIDRKPKIKTKTKTFLIGKELKTKDLRQTAADRASGPTTKSTPNPGPEPPELWCRLTPARPALGPIHGRD